MAKKSAEDHPILLVEDDLDHAELVKRSLAEHQVSGTIHHVKDGEEALDYLFRRGAYADGENAPSPHIVLLDLRLPKVDGIEVLQEIRTSERLHRIPIVILTTSNAESDVAKAYECRANSYIVKPVDFEKFKKLMADFGAYWFRWNHFPWTE